MKVSMKYWRSSIVLAVLAVVLMGSTTAFAAQNPNPGVLPPQSHPNGLTYGEWSNAWWQWALSIPASVNPLLAPTGVIDCSKGQSGHVWFLAGTLGGPPVTRSCTIPAGRALFFPIVNDENNNLGCPPSIYNVDQLHQQINAFIDSVTTLFVKIDGVDIQGLQSYRAETGNSTFSVTLPSDNLFTSASCTIPAGTYESQVSDGYYLMLAPLSVGKHTIHFIGKALGTSLPIPIPPLTTDVTYNLTVQPG